MRRAFKAAILGLAIGMTGAGLYIHRDQTFKTCEEAQRAQDKIAKKYSGGEMSGEMNAKFIARNGQQCDVTSRIVPKQQF